METPGLAAEEGTKTCPENEENYIKDNRHIFIVSLFDRIWVGRLNFTRN